MKFRKKPVVIDAIQWDGFNKEELSRYMGEEVRTVTREEGKCIRIATLEGEMIASPQDWVIKGVKGEFYPCKPDIFESTYDEVEE